MQAFLTQSVTKVLNTSLRSVTVWVPDDGDSVVKNRLLSPAKAWLVEMALAVSDSFSLASKGASSSRL